jgi:pilus assembly protein Flp/PilA
MQGFVRIAREFLRCEDGPTAVEYAVMAAMIIAVCVSAVQAVGANTKTNLNKANTAWSAGS